MAFFAGYGLVFEMVVIADFEINNLSDYLQSYATGRWWGAKRIHQIVVANQIWEGGNYNATKCYYMIFRPNKATLISYFHKRNIVF